MNLAHFLSNCIADPMQWSENQVIQWLDWTIKEFGCTPVNKCNWRISGLQLCTLSKEEFLERAPPYTGDVLHSHLNLLKAKGTLSYILGDRLQY